MDLVASLWLVLLHFEVVDVKLKVSIVDNLGSLLENEQLVVVNGPVKGRRVRTSSLHILSHVEFRHLRQRVIQLHRLVNSIESVGHVPLSDIHVSRALNVIARRQVDPFHV